MDTINPSDNKALDRALIQCLRLFAKHGHKVRCQEMSSVAKVSDSAGMEKEAEQAGEQGSCKNKTEQE